MTCRKEVSAIRKGRRGLRQREDGAGGAWGPRDAHRRVPAPILSHRGVCGGVGGGGMRVAQSTHVLRERACSAAFKGSSVGRGAVAGTGLPTSLLLCWPELLAVR